MGWGGQFRVSFRQSHEGVGPTPWAWAMHAFGCVIYRGEAYVKPFGAWVPEQNAKNNYTNCPSIYVHDSRSWGTFSLYIGLPKFHIHIYKGPFLFLGGVLCHRLQCKKMMPLLYRPASSIQHSMIIWQPWHDDTNFVNQTLKVKIYLYSMTMNLLIRHSWVPKCHIIEAIIAYVTGPTQL